MVDSGFIYVWFDRKNRRYYVGAHWGAPDDGYVCSSRWMRRAYKQRPADFKRRIVAVVTTNRTDLFEKEARWLAMIKPSEFKRRYYNLKNTPDNLWHFIEDSRLTTAEKISKALKGRKIGEYSEEHREAIRNGKLAGAAKRREETGHSYDADFGRRMSEAKLSNPYRHTKKHKKYMCRKMREARAANPEWDHAFDKNCVGCGTAFKGRESQKYCSFACGKAHKYTLQKDTWNHRYDLTCARCGAAFKGPKDGRYCSRQCAAKINGDDAKEIRRLHAAGSSQVAIAKEYSITQAAVSLIIRGKTWRAA